MHCNAFIMLYLKEHPLRRSLECIAMHSKMYLKDSPLRSSDYIFAKCMLLYFAGNIKRQVGEGPGGNEG